ncbi:MAG: hypothetical protein HY916_09165 [Desulfovibrio sp.]|jgi:hypothetical protein|nr:hypothetical protein [Desulfovibrio sp.]
MSDTPIQALGIALRAEFDANAALRRASEKRWLDDLRQYLGVYDAETLKLLKEQNRSIVYLRKTKAKVDAIHSRLGDLLFPAKGDRNWDIGPSTTPEVHPNLLMEAAHMEAARLKRQLDKEELRSLTVSLAADSARQMGDEMEMQLAEAPGRRSYRANSKKLLFQGTLYGCGVLKGPLVERRKREKFAYSDQSGWALGSDEGAWWPYHEFVSIWDCYPDMIALNPDQLRFVWQNHLKTRKDLLALCQWPGFDAGAIRAYLKEKPDGDAQLKEHESEMRNVAGEKDERQVPSDLKGRYRLLERWGQLSGKQLIDAGVEGVEEDQDYAANVWLLGASVVKAVLAPIEGVDIPYSFFFYSEDETCFFPEGVASFLRHPEKAFNAAIRMMLDNAAICSGPQIAINQSALVTGTKTDEFRPFKVWNFKSVQDLSAAMKVFNVTSSIPDLVNVAKLMADWADEVTSPRFMAGDGPTKGAAETASGLSMLMGAAGVTFKGLVSNFDDGITRPFVTSLYYWNMRFNSREEIKGDFVVRATGTTALMAAEIQAQNAMKAIQLSQMPQYKHDFKNRELLEQVVKHLDLGAAALRTEEEAEQEREREARAQARLQAEANIEAIVAAAEKRGIPIQQALVGMLGEGVKQLGMAQ